MTSSPKSPIRARATADATLSAILALAVLARLSGAKCYQVIAQFGRDKGFALAHLLGFTRAKSPFSVLFRLLDVPAFEQGTCSG